MALSPGFHISLNVVGILGFSRETTPKDIYKRNLLEELAYVIMEAEKFYNLLSASSRPGKPVVPVLT